MLSPYSRSFLQRHLPTRSTNYSRPTIRRRAAECVELARRACFAKVLWRRLVVGCEKESVRGSKAIKVFSGIRSTQSWATSWFPFPGQQSGVEPLWKQALSSDSCRGIREEAAAPAAVSVRARQMGQTMFGGEEKDRCWDVREMKALVAG